MDGQEFAETSSFETLAFAFDVKVMRLELNKIIETVPPIMPSASFGGWSLLSRDGTVADGWHQGHLAFRKDEAGFQFDAAAGVRLGFQQWVSDYSVRTELCQGYFLEILNEVERRGLNPRRARISVINPGHETALHVDGPSDSYAVRLHIPIITNDQCAFAYKDQQLHMAANGDGILVRVNHPHRAYNRGSEPRYHLIMDVFDFHGATRFHRFDSSKERLPTWRGEPPTATSAAGTSKRS